MADDIVERLRRHRDLGAGERFYMDSYAAADEIERLRTELHTAEKWRKKYQEEKKNNE